MKNYTKSFWIGGKYAVLEAVKNKNNIIQAISVKEQNFALIKDLIDPKKIKVSNENFFNKTFYNSNITHQGFAAKIQSPIKKLDFLKQNLAKYSSIALLDNIFDDRNVGSIVRSAAAFNLNAIIVEEKNFRHESQMLHKSSSGMINHIDLIMVKNLKHALNEFKKNNFWVYGLDISSKNLINKKNSVDKFCLILGSEGKGIRKSLLDYCDELLKIEINRNVDSLNVANSASIAMYELNSK